MTEDSYSSEDVKRAKRNAGIRKRREREINRIIAEYKQGRGASSCMADIIKIVEGKS